jgi:hypothetical protein
VQGIAGADQHGADARELEVTDQKVSRRNGGVGGGGVAC